MSTSGTAAAVVSSPGPTSQASDNLGAELGAGNHPPASSAPSPLLPSPVPRPPMMLSSMDLEEFIQFKMGLDAFNFTQWRSSINFLHARHHVQDHVRHGHANHLIGPKMDNNIVLWSLNHRGGLID